MASSQFALSLGYQADLIKGIRHAWDKQSSSGSPFFAPSSPSQLRTQDLAAFDPHAPFDLLELSFHYSWKSLNDALFGGWHVTDAGLSGRTGTLVLDQNPEAPIQQEICEKLGIDPQDAQDANTAFALVKLTRRVSTTKYPTQPSVSGRQLAEAFAALPTEASNAGPFLESFAVYGTHYIHSLTVGDYLYQVFVYDAPVLREIEPRFPESKRTGVLAHSFQVYTEPKTQYSGYTKRTGRLMLASEDPTLDAHREDFKDTVNHVDCSIFSALEPDVAQNVLSRLQSITPIACELANLSALISNTAQRCAWDSVLQSAFYQKYGAGIDPQFPPVSTSCDYNAIYKAFEPPTPSSISTSSMIISQIRVDLATIVSLHPENVKKILIIADVVEITRDVTLPGDDVSIFCREFVARTTSTKAPVLRLRDKGYAGFNLRCREFDGSVELRSTKSQEHKLISLGEGFQTIMRDGQPTVGLGTRYRENPPIDALRLGDRTSYTLGFPLQSAQSILSHPISANARRAARAFAQWMSDILKPATASDPALVDIRAQALLLLKLDPSAGASVPNLTYEAYKPAIDAMMAAADAFAVELHAGTQLIETREAEKQIYETQNELNKNIQEMGKFLLAQNEALAAKEADLVNYFDDVQNKQDQMLASAKEKLADLSNKLLEQQEVMADAEVKLKGYVSAYAIEQFIKVALQVATAIATLFVGGVGLKSLKDDSLQNLARLMRKVDSSMKIIDGITKLFDPIDNTVQTTLTVINSMTSLPDEVDFPTALDWNEYDAEVYAAINPLTSKIPYANTYLKEAKVLSARGRAFLDAASQVAKLETENERRGWLRDINDAQAKRLASLSTTLSLPSLSQPQVDSIDLYELNAMYQARSSSVILQLVQTLSLQDAALQYYYLQAPAQFNSYDIVSIKEAMVMQAKNSITALDNFPSKPTELKTPVDVVLRAVPVAALIGQHAETTAGANDAALSREAYDTYTGDNYEFSIELDFSDFINYVRVRILEIEMRVDGVRSTRSGKLAVRLDTSAYPFSDRSLERERLDFNTTPLRFEYVYDLRSGACVYTNRASGEFAKLFMKMTPFTRWKLSLPMGEQSENAGIEFERDAVDVTLRFYVEAIRFSATF